MDIQTVTEIVQRIDGRIAFLRLEIERAEIHFSNENDLAYHVNRVFLRIVELNQLRSSFFGGRYEVIKDENL